MAPAHVWVSVPQKCYLRACLQHLKSAGALWGLWSWGEGLRNSLLTSLCGPGLRGVTPRRKRGKRRRGRNWVRTVGGSSLKTHGARGKGPDFIEKSERTRKARLLDPRSRSSSWPASFKEDLVTLRDQSATPHSSTGLRLCSWNSVAVRLTPGWQRECPLMTT